MNFGSWFRSPPTPASPPPAGSASRIEYVDALLAMMLKKSLFTLRLTAAEPLPRIGIDDGVADNLAHYQAVINRLKVMSRLNPIIYATPMQGKIEMPCGTYILVYETRFDDKGTPPTCQINLRVRNQ